MDNLLRLESETSYKGSSENSLDWDPGEAGEFPTLFEQQLSTSLSDLGDSVFNPTIADSTATDTIMVEVSDEVHAATNKLGHTIIIYEDDFIGLDIEPLNLQVLKEKIAELKELKIIIRDTMYYLDSVDHVAYIQDHKEKAERVKKEIIQFIRRIEVKICGMQTAVAEKAQEQVQYRENLAATASAAAFASRPSSPLKVTTSAFKFKKDRVEAYGPLVVKRMESIVEEFTILLVKSVEDDVQYFQFEDRFNALRRRGEELLKDATSIVPDAVFVELTTEALVIEGNVYSLKRIMDETESKKEELKVKFGLLGASVDRSINVTIPTFSGKLSDMDFFTFKSKFNEYMKIARMTTAKQLLTLKEECLTDSKLKSSASRLTTVEQVFEYLEKHFGNCEILFNNRKSELSKVGKLPWYEKGKGAVDPNKQRDWAFSIQTKLIELQDMAERHGLENRLYYSDILSVVENLFSFSIQEEYHAILLKNGKPNDEKMSYDSMLSFIDSLVARFTFKIQHLSSSIGKQMQDSKFDKNKSSDTKKQEDWKQRNKSTFHSDRVNNRQEKQSSNQSRGKRNTGRKNTPRTQVKCPVEGCEESHSHIYFCEKFQAIRDFKKRFDMCANYKVCMRCLALDTNVDFSDRKAWWTKHEPNCFTDFACDVEFCGDRNPSGSKHILVCYYHYIKNKEERLSDFTQSIDKEQLKPNSRFFTMVYHSDALDSDIPIVYERDTLPDITDPGIFVIHNITVENDVKLKIFYDGGAAGAAMSDRAYKYLDARCERPGPTYLAVAGGGVIRIDGGDEKFKLELDDRKHHNIPDDFPWAKKATFTALKMTNITTPFPTWELTEAWSEVALYHKTKNLKCELPFAPKSVGGCTVDILIGIQYKPYHPTELFSLPCGLAVYRSKLKCSDGNQAVLGGPHPAWRKAYEGSMHLGPTIFFTAEARAWYFQERVLHDVMTLESFEKTEVDQSAIDENDIDEKILEDLVEREDDHECLPRCQTLECCLTSIGTELKNFERTEEIGSEMSYRCLKCRSCHDCKNGDTLESISLKEEQEQAQLELGIWLDVDKKRLYTSLPFLRDPEINLTENKHVAKKVLEQQIKLSKRNPDMVPGLVKSHNKLVSNGFARPLKELSKSEFIKMGVFNGKKNYLIWRSVYKTGSISTPVRIVFDASARTPGGESLNSILATGKNQLGSLYQILLRFRSKKLGLTCDVSMAYNQVFLEEAYWKYQMYLWQDGLNPDNPIQEMVVISLIYGVSPSGNITIVGFYILADYVITYYPLYKEGAMALKEDAYMDDIATGADSEEQLDHLKKGIVFTLDQGSMKVKGFTVSGEPPIETVSSDGISVDLTGYRWQPVNDTIMLASREIYLEKIKRGMIPEAIKGDLKEALKLKFTRRVISGKVAGVYDPLGLVTPVVSGLKLDLHEVTMLKLDWDTLIPDQYLDKWVRNIERIQETRDIPFRRAVIPMGAVNTNVELIMCSDASEKIAVAAVYCRFTLRSGEFSSQLQTSKSKLVTTSTVPRAELKAARMGASLGYIAKLTWQDSWVSSKFITDSTIVLQWIHQDQRPLQTAVRNAVIEIRRFSCPSEWFHIDGTLNVADTGTRQIEPSEIDFESIWQCGPSWMRLPVEEMPLRPLSEIKLTGEEKRQAAIEMKAPDIRGISVFNTSRKQDLEDLVAARYSLGEYIPDPARVSWPALFKCRAAINRFVNNLKKAVKKELTVKGHKNPKNVFFSDEEISIGATYFWERATMEVKKFGDSKEYKNAGILVEGVLHYDGRILEGQLVEDVDNLFPDLEPLTFVRPIVDRFSPLAYSLMIHKHSEKVHHRNAAATLQATRWEAFILAGKNLAIEVVDKCPGCRRHRAKLLKVEMGKIHSNRLTIAPAFYYSQCDLFGPLTAICEHNHRSTVKIWGCVFKCTSTCAVSVYVMQNYSTDAFLGAFTRFGAVYGYPKKLFIDEGAQLVKGCKEMEIEIMDMLKPLDSKFQTGIEFETVPVGGHNANGMVERSIREIKKIYFETFGGLRMDILNYETAFAWVSSELNAMPICLGSDFKGFENLDLMTPEMLLKCKNSSRSPVGFAEIATPSRLLAQLEKAKKAWWKVFTEEGIQRFIPRGSKWGKTSQQPKVGDVVIFTRSESELGTLWRVGLVEDLIISPKDGLARDVVIKYKYHPEEKIYKQKEFKTTHRAVRKIAILETESELGLKQVLSQASKKANINFFRYHSSVYSSQPVCGASCFTCVPATPIKAMLHSAEENCVVCSPYEESE